MMNSTFKDEDVKILLKIVNKNAIVDQNKSNIVKHYCNYIPDENNLPTEYLEIFDELLDFTSKEISIYVGILDRKILSEYKNVVIVSLLRAGTVIGVLIKNILVLY